MTRSEQLREHQCAKRVIQVVCENRPTQYWFRTYRTATPKGDVRGLNKDGREVVVNWTHCPTQRDAETVVPGVMFMAGIRHVDLKPCVIVPLEDLDADGKAWIEDHGRKVSLAEYMGHQLLRAVQRPEIFDRLPENPTEIVVVDEHGRPATNHQAKKLQALEDR